MNVGFWENLLKVKSCTELTDFTVLQICKSTIWVKLLQRYMQIYKFDIQTSQSEQAAVFSLHRHRLQPHQVPIHGTHTNTKKVRVS